MILTNDILKSYNFQNYSEERYFRIVDEWFTFVIRKESNKYYLSDYSGNYKLSKPIETVNELKVLYKGVTKQELKQI